VPVLTGEGGSPTQLAGYSAAREGDERAMRVLPKKVEGKIFVLVLIISVSMGLLASRLISMAQEQLVLATNRDRLTARTDRSRDVIAEAISVREAHAASAHERISDALKNPEDLDLTSQDESIRDAISVRITGTSRDKWDDTCRARIAAAADAMSDIRSLISSDFPHYFVHFPDHGVTLHLGADQSAAQLRPIDATPAGSSANPSHNPVWLTENPKEQASALWVRVLIPLYLDNKFVGVTGADLPMDTLLQTAGVSDSTNFGTLLIYSARGETLAGQDSPWETSIRNELAGINTQPPDANPETGSYVFEENGTQLYASATVLPRLGWRIVAVANTQAVFEELTTLKIKLALVALTLSMVMVMLLRASFRQLFVKRVQVLEKATRAFAQHGISRFPSLGDDEIGSLGRAFEEMIESLSNRESELTIRNQQLKNEISGRLSAVESLRESERKFRTLFDKSSDGVLVLDGDRYIDCNEAAIEMLECESKADLLAADPAQFHPAIQPDGRDSVIVEAEMSTIAKHKGEHRFEWFLRTLTGREFWVEVVLTWIPYGGRDVLYTVWRDITVRKREEDERIRLASALEQAAEVIVVTDKAGIIQYVNPSFERITQFTREESLGKHKDLIHAEKQDSPVLADMQKSTSAGKVWKGRIANSRKDGTLYQSETTISPVRDATGAIRNFVIVSYDVTKEATLEAQLIQAQKMEAIGELASGIAHEINTPTQYVGDNIRFFQESFKNILTLLTEYEGLVQALKDQQPAMERATAVEQLAKAIDLEYLREEIPTAIQQSLEGNTRVAEIVRAMKEFAHPGLEEKAGYDINHGIQNTIAVARNEWKYVADIQLDLDPGLPEVPCLPGSFNQVILNMVVNAAHAISDVVDGGAKGKGTISISSRASDGWAEIRVSDSGTGIPESIRKKIFDPFFTTKRAGKGTGQGLALAHAVIVDKHSGTIDVESELGKGTTFIIRLPLADTHLTLEEAELAGSSAHG